MIAFLIYLIGLVSAVVTLIVVGFDLPAIYTALANAYAGGLETLLPALGQAARGLDWALAPFLGGLLLMGFARIMMLLGTIARALRGPA